MEKSRDFENNYKKLIDAWNKMPTKDIFRSSDTEYYLHNKL
jgi:hypothetical protein